MLTTAEQHLLATVDSLEDELRELLVNLVRADSVNPPGDTRNAARICASVFQSFADEVRELDCDPLMPNLLATINPGKGPQLLFNSHIDVVPTGTLDNWHYDPFAADIVDGVLYGRGSADAKGCMAPMMIAAKALRQSGVELGGSLVVNPVSDEEVGGMKGAQWLVENDLIKPDLVVIGEITSNRVAIAHKGVLFFRLITHGRTAHASTPWTGINAISHMVTLLYELERELQAQLAKRTHPLTPPPSYNFGTIQGGVKVNVVADRCQVELDRRVLPSENIDEVIAQVKALVAEIQRKHPEINATIEVVLKGSPLETAPEHPLTQIALAAAVDLGLPGEPVGYEQASDGRFFSERGIPTILIGPGTAHFAHQPDEHIPLADVYAAARLYALLAYRVLARK
jgi:acetylornithine deacetylase/succinyl-diaminopimelate desuccinylase family protein